ncbi:gliding motility protein GldM [Planktosalinus lacus]|uniref:Gliding motility protein GldM n=2 Tax=Planktosalinus lacus TaxID=1526573 RepID=A0A8J2V940_9FLAO|nr:gliding motility protein GldM [Planktosalinus lacus]
MINLMYLVFIAMLALNMSKEVLSAFGLMNERLTEANMSAEQRNSAYMAGLAEKATEQPEKYVPLKAKADEITALSADFDAYIESIKTDLKATVKDDDMSTRNYEVMDKPDYLNQTFFVGDKLTPEGQQFVDNVDAYREGVLDAISDLEGEKYDKIRSDINDKFDTAPEDRRDGVKVDWLKYHYEGFPMIASLTKLTQMQSDVKTTNTEVLSTLLEGQLQSDVSLDNYEAIVVPEKTAFFSGENFKGRVILGRFDNSMTFDKVTVNGNDIESTQAGQVLLDFPAGNVGEQEISGVIQYVENDSVKSIEIKSSYAVIPKPNAAVISADKMNVVYRGVKNPMTISIPGVGQANATAPGLTSAGGSGKYVMDVTTVQGREVNINVTGSLPGGETVSDSKSFRIKDIPRPVGTVRGEDGLIKMQRNALEISTIGAMIPDFDFEISLNVTGFKFNVPGQPTVVVNGGRLNEAAKNTLRRARRGETVQIFDITANLAGASGYRLQKISPVFVELTN